MAVLLQRPGILRQSDALRDNTDIWSHPAQVRLPADAAPAARQVPGGEGQDAAGETRPSPYTLPQVRHWAEVLGLFWKFGLFRIGDQFLWRILKKIDSNHEFKVIFNIKDVI